MPHGAKLGTIGVCQLSYGSVRRRNCAISPPSNAQRGSERTFSVSNVLSRVLTSFLTGTAAAGAVLIGAPGTAGAEPAPPPPPAPNIDGYAMALPSEYAVNDALYAFSTPQGLTCVLTRGTSSYGCSGPIPGAPGGANVVTAGPTGMPGFTSSDRPLYAADKPAKQLPANTRLSYSTISCGVDAAGATICTNSFDQTGFVLGPANSFTFGELNPLLARPDGSNPYAN